MLACLAVAAISTLLAAFVALRAKSTNEARAIGIAGAFAALVASLFAFAFEEESSARLASLVTSEPWAGGLAAFVSAITLSAVAMSPAAGASKTTIARILFVSAASLALVSIRHPVSLAIFWPLSALPVWLELRDRAESRASARVFALYMIPSSILAVVGAALVERGMSAQALVPLAASIAIRQAIVPFHSWLVNFVERAPMGLVVVFVAPQLGVYAHLEWLADDLRPSFESAVASLGAVTVVFGAVMGVVQTRARRALGYLMISQTALVALGLDTPSAIARAGSLTTWHVCGLALTGLCMTTAALEARRGTLSLESPNGSFRRIPFLASAYLLLGLSSVGLSGTLGFIAEDLLVQGTVDVSVVLALVLIVGTALNSVTIVRSFFALFTGARKSTGERDLTLRERAALTLVLGALVLSGVWPSAAVPWLGGVDEHAQLETHR